MVTVSVKQLAVVPATILLLRHTPTLSAASPGWTARTTTSSGRTQSWGQIPKVERDFLRSIGVSPGTACNGSPRK